MKYHYSILRIEPNRVRGEFFNYGCMIWNKDYSEWRVSINFNPLLLKGYELAYHTDYEDIIQNELEDWEAFFKNRNDKTVEYWHDKMTMGINQLTSPLPILVGPESSVKNLEEAVDFLMKTFAE